MRPTCQFASKSGAINPHQLYSKEIKRTTHATVTWHPHIRLIMTVTAAADDILLQVELTLLLPSSRIMRLLLSLMSSNVRNYSQQAGRQSAIQNSVQRSDILTWKNMWFTSTATNKNKLHLVDSTGGLSSFCQHWFKPRFKLVFLPRNVFTSSCTLGADQYDRHKCN